jgi:hypothetical protein
MTRPLRERRRFDATLHKPLIGVVYFGAGGLREVARLKIQQEDEEVDSRLRQVTQTLDKVRIESV